MKFKYQRRYFLKGAGTVLIGLPLLEESFFSNAMANTPIPPKRLLTMSFGLGIEKDLQDEGWNGPLAPLQSVASKAAFFSNLKNTHLASGGTPHFRVGGTQFTGVKQPNDRKAGGPSLEQIMRQALHPNGVPSLTGLPSKSAGVWSRTGSPTQYIRHWNNDGSPGEKPERRPSKVFDSIFGTVSTTRPPSQTPANLGTGSQEARSSILDAVMDQYRSLTGNNSYLGQASKAKIEAHLDAIRSIEKQLEAGDQVVDQMEGNEGPVATIPSKNSFQDPSGISFYDAQSGSTGGGAPDVSYTAAQQAFRLIGDLYALGLASDALRFGSLVFVGAGGHIRFSGVYEAQGIGNRNFSNDFDSGTPHDLIFHSYNKDYIRIYQHYSVSQLAYVLNKMDSILEPNGKTLLDNTCVVLGTEYGRNHDGSKGIFHAIVGGNGLFNPGFYGQNYGFNDVYKTVLDAYNIPHNISGASIAGLLNG